MGMTPAAGTKGRYRIKAAKGQSQVAADCPEDSKVLTRDRTKVLTKTKEMCAVTQTSTCGFYMNPQTGKWAAEPRYGGA